MLLYGDSQRVHQADFFGVWRADDVVGIRVEGELTDARNPVWRAWVDEYIARTGTPRFIALDVRRAIPMASLPMRIQTALWGRRVLGMIERGVVGVGEDARVGFTVKAILRVTGMANITIAHDDASLDAAVAGLR